MSLRLMFKLVLAMLVVASLILIVMQFRKNQEPAPAMQSEFRELQGMARVTRGTVMRPGAHAIEFVLPPSASAVRILSNANLRNIDDARRDREADPSRRWNFVLEVEEIRSDGSSAHTQHPVRRDLLELALPNGRTGSGSFYLQNDAPWPLAASTLRLDYAGGARPSRLRIRVVSSDPDITDVLLRVATPEPLTQRSAETMWRRLSDLQRTRLSSGNVYPPDLLIEQERNNLMTSRWRPLGPSGEVEGRDIYVLDLADRGAPVEPFKSAVQTVGPGRVLVVQLPETGGRLRVELEPITLQSQSRPAKVNLRWAGHSAFQRRTQSFEWNGGVFSHDVVLGGGRIELAASRDATVRVAILESGVPRDITPVVQYLRNWNVEPESPLEFAISHEGVRSTPLRLVMRRVVDAGAALSRSTVDVTLLGDGRKVLHRLNVDVGPIVRSQYDHLWPQVALARLSEPYEAFFRLPKNVRVVRVSAADPLLVVAYTRPLELPRAVRTPEDTTSPEVAASAIPAWFGLQPEDAQERILNGRSRLITTQDRLPDDRPDLTSGRYAWESFTPMDHGLGRVFLAPREEGVPERIEGLPGIFRELPQSSKTTFLTESGRLTSPVRLAWTADAPRVFTYSVNLNGLAWTSGVLSGAAGEVALPSVPEGEHLLEIQADSGVRWFANYVRDGTPWVKRLAYQFDKPLQFEVQRNINTEEFLSVRLFRPAGIKGRVRVRADMQAPPSQEGIGPLPGWFFAQRVHDVRPSGEVALPVAETANERTDAGQPFFIPFPRGAPTGRYILTLTPEGGVGWVSVSRISAEIAPLPKVFVESVRNGE